MADQDEDPIRAAQRVRQQKNLARHAARRTSQQATRGTSPIVQLDRQGAPPSYEDDPLRITYRAMPAAERHNRGLYRRWLGWPDPTDRQDQPAAEFDQFVTDSREGVYGA